ncbi:polysaccharide biosynthesis C-terminal domain-containing protein, partial [Thermodesulfobacteriota bacterium]
ALLVNQPGGYAEMGAYNAILRVKQVPIMVLGMLVAPLLPILSECFGKKDAKSYNKMLSYAFRMSLCIVVPISLIQTAAPMLTLLPFGQEYQGYTNIVQWLMLHAVLVGLFHPFGRILASMGRMWFGFAYNLSWGAFLLVFTYLLVPPYGAAGLAAASALTHLITSLFCVGYIYHYEKAFIVGTPLGYFILSVLFLFCICATVSYWVPPLMAGGIGFMAALTLVVILMHLTKVRSVQTESIMTKEPFKEK